MGRQMGARGRAAEAGSGMLGEGGAGGMKIIKRYTENVTLTVNATKKMVEDYRICRWGRGIKGVEPACATCSLNIDLDCYGYLSLCELRSVKEELDKLLEEGRES